MVWEEREASEGLRTRVQPWRRVTPPPVTVGGEGERKPRDWKVTAAEEGTPGLAFSPVAPGGMGTGTRLSLRAVRPRASLPPSLSELFPKGTRGQTWGQWGLPLGSSPSGRRDSGHEQRLVGEDRPTRVAWL